MTGFSSRRDRLWSVALQLVQEETSVSGYGRQEEDHCNRIRTKFNQLVSNLTCLGEILAHMLQHKKLTWTEKDYINQFQSTPIRANEELLNVVACKDQDAYECFLTALRNTNQTHLYQFLTSANDSEKIASEHKEAICRNFTWLLDHLDTEYGLVALLYERKVLAHREKEEITCNKDRFNRSETLLSIISRKSAHDFEIFLAALEDSDQRHVAAKLRQLKGSSFVSSRVSVKSIKKRNTVTFQPSLLSKPAHKKQCPHSKPAVPPKPSINKPQINRQAIKLEKPCIQKLERTKCTKKAKLNKIRKRFSELENRLQTKISIKVTSIRQRSLDETEDILTNCLRKVLHDSLQARKELHKKDADKRVDLEEMSKNEETYLAASSLNGVLRSQLSSQEQELVSQKNVIFRITEKRQELQGQLDKLKDDATNYRTKCKRLEGENHQFAVRLKKMETKLRNEICEKEILKNQLEEARARIELAEDAVQTFRMKHEEDSKRLEELRLLRSIDVKKSEERGIISESETYKWEKQLIEMPNLLALNEDEIRRITVKIDEDSEERDSKLKLVEAERDGLKKTCEQLKKENENNMKAIEKDLFPTNENIRKLMGEVADGSFVPKENFVLRNNQQFLMENLDPRFLIDHLHAKGFITEEQRHHMDIQPGTFYRNDELLQWMRRTFIFKGNIRLAVLQCLRDTKQAFMADVLENGGVLVKAKISNKVVLQPKSPFKPKVTKDIATQAALKETEASVVTRLNRSISTPPVEERLSGAVQTSLDDKIIKDFQLKKKLKFGLTGTDIVSRGPERVKLCEEIDFAPFCHQEDKGIVVWFWCHSQIHLNKLRGMYTSGKLLEQVTDIFKQLPNNGNGHSSTAILVPLTLTIFSENLQRTTEFSNYKNNPILLHTSETKASEKTTQESME